MTFQGQTLAATRQNYFPIQKVDVIDNQHT